jgi:hypothetical protein
MASIEQLKTQVSRANGIAQANQFAVELPQISGYTGRTLNLLCKNVTLPGKQITTKEKMIGLFSEKVVDGFVVDDVSMTFHVLNDYHTKLQGEELVPVEFSDTDIIEGDLITSVNTSQIITAEYFTPEYLSARYHTIDGKIIDYLPFTSEGAGQVRVTQLEYYTQENDKLKLINVLKPSAVNQVVSAFNQAVRA